MGNEHVNRVQKPASLTMPLLGLLMACPFDQTNPGRCPLHWLRQESLEKRMVWLDNLSIAEAEVLMANHRHCLSLLESSQIGN